MPSNFATFKVQAETEPGSISPVGAGVDVIAYDTVADADLDTFTTDSNGEIAGDALSCDVGTLVVFRVENYFGKAANASQITT